MSNWLEKRVFWDEARRRVRYLQLPDYSTTRDLARDVIDQADRDFQAATPVTLHLPEPRVMAGVWAVFRESTLAGPVDRAQREAVASTVSSLNRCPFCVDAHSVMVRGVGKHEVADLLLEGKFADPKWKETEYGDAVRWAAATYLPKSAELLNSPFSAGSTPYMFGTAVGFHYVNRMVNVFLNDSPFPQPPFKKLMAPLVHRVAGRFFGQPSIQKQLSPGDSLTFLNDAELPKEFAWAESAPNVAAAYAGANAAINDAADRWVSPAVRETLIDHLQAWKGEAAPMSREWVADAVSSLSEADRPAGTLAFLVARASFQVDGGIVKNFRRQALSDAALVATCAWASFQAMRRIASWLPLK